MPRVTRTLWETQGRKSRLVKDYVLLQLLLCEALIYLVLVWYVQSLSFRDVAIKFRETVVFREVTIRTSPALSVKWTGSLISSSENSVSSNSGYISCAERRNFCKQFATVGSWPLFVIQSSMALTRDSVLLSKLICIDKLGKKASSFHAWFCTASLTLSFVGSKSRIARATSLVISVSILDTPASIGQNKFDVEFFPEHKDMSEKHARSSEISTR